MIQQWLELSQKDFRELNREATWAIIPISSIEQHGFHLPVGTDTLILKSTLEAIKDGVETSRTLLQLPQLYYGKSTEHTNFPGTITLSPETIQSMLYDIVASLVHHDFRNIIIINSHGGNSGLLEGLLYDLRIKYQVNIYMLHLSSVFRNADKSAEFDWPHSAHAACFETSFMLYQYPKLVKKDLIPKESLSSEGFEFFKTIIGNVAWGWAIEDLSPTGYIGSPQLASMEKGKEIVSKLSTSLSALIKTIVEGP